MGRQLRQVHLLESEILDKPITKFPIDGSALVENIYFEDNKVYINQNQYFQDVPEVAWNIFIGAYQPAQKWLKDRKGRSLSFDEIVHYQMIIVALNETDRLMKEIERISKI